MGVGGGRDAAGCGGTCLRRDDYAVRHPLLRRNVLPRFKLHPARNRLPARCVTLRPAVAEGAAPARPAHGAPLRHVRPVELTRLRNADNRKQLRVLLGVLRIRLRATSVPRRGRGGATSVTRPSMLNPPPAPSEPNLAPRPGPNDDGRHWGGLCRNRSVQFTFLKVHPAFDWNRLVCLLHWRDRWRYLGLVRSVVRSPVLGVAYNLAIDPVSQVGAILRTWQVEEGGGGGRGTGEACACGCASRPPPPSPPPRTFSVIASPKGASNGPEKYVLAAHIMQQLPGPGCTVGSSNAASRSMNTSGKGSTARARCEAGRRG